MGRHLLIESKEPLLVNIPKAHPAKKKVDFVVCFLIAKSRLDIAVASEEMDYVWNCRI